MEQVTKHKEYMELALELAQRGFGSVEPNPMVGCVILKDGKIIGKGWHKVFGGAHGEIEALNDARENGFDPAGATMCVTLEPCCHFGKTPPCTDAIIAAGITKVVVAMEDPSSKVAGKGIKQLQDAGIKVTVGLCEKQAKLLNPGFIKYSQRQLPWVILKWAQSIDGKLGLKDRQEERWVSGSESRKDVHKLRRSVQAILVGVNTVLADDPLLTARPSKGKDLIRIVVDSNLRLPMDCQLLRTIDQGPVLIATTKEAIETHQVKAGRVLETGADFIALPANSQGQCDLKLLIAELGERGVQRLLVEGGAEIITSFLKDGLADEAAIYIAPKIFGSQGVTSISQMLTKLPIAPILHYVKTSSFGDDMRICGLLKTLEEISNAE